MCKEKVTFDQRHKACFSLFCVLFYVIKEMVRGLACSIKFWMHLGSCESTQKSRVCVPPIDLSQDTVDLVSTGQKSLVLTKASLSILVRHVLGRNNSRETRHSKFNMSCPRYKCKTEGGKTFAVRTIIDWNSIDINIRNKATVSSFKRNIYNKFLNDQKVATRLEIWYTEHIYI